MAEQTQPGTAIDRPTVRRAERQMRDRRQQFDAALAEVMATPAGRLVLWEILELTECRGSAWSPHRMQLAFNVGRQSVGHQLEVDLNRACDAHYETMDREARARRRQAAVEHTAFQAERAAARRSEETE